MYTTIIGISIKSCWLLAANVSLWLSSNEVWYEKNVLGIEAKIPTVCSSSTFVTMGELAHLSCSTVLNSGNKVINLPYFKEMRISDNDEL